MKTWLDFEVNKGGNSVIRLVNSYDNSGNAFEGNLTHTVKVDLVPPQYKSHNIVNLTDKFSNNKPKNFFAKHKKQLIASLTFLILMFIFSLHQVNRLLFSFMPKLLLENGQISITGIALKSLFTTILFALVIFLSQKIHPFFGGNKSAK